MIQQRKLEDDEIDLVSTDTRPSKRKSTCTSEENAYIPKKIRKFSVKEIDTNDEQISS